MFDKNVFGSIWVKSEKCFSKNLEYLHINLTYNPSKPHLEKFLGKISYNLEHAFRQCNTVHALGDINLKYLNKSEKIKLESIITTYALQIVDVHEPTSPAQNSESYFDNNLTEIIEENSQQSFDAPFKSNH